MLLNYSESIFSGFYKKSYLRRHKCPVKQTEDKLKSGYLASVSQTFMVQLNSASKTTTSIELREKVFSKMNVNEVSRVAKSGVLITSYGSHYLKDKNRPQLYRVCATKLRQLSSLLIEARKVVRDENCTFDNLLKPENYEIWIRIQCRNKNVPIAKSRAGTWEAFKKDDKNVQKTDSSKK